MAPAEDTVHGAYKRLNGAAAKLLQLCRILPADTNTADSNSDVETIADPQQPLDQQTIQRQRRIPAHPEIRVVRDPRDRQCQVITVVPNAELQPTDATLQAAETAAREVFNDVKFSEQTHRVGASISKFSVVCMKNYVGDALKPNSKYRYATDLNRSKVQPINKQLGMLPQPLQTAMRFAVGEFHAELRGMEVEDRRYALYRATSNAFKQMSSHKKRNAENVRRAVRDRQRQSATDEEDGDH